ncbi:alternate F1F0 ATPase, F1 subunit alpha [Marimonas arenosa]|uniref:ATP synthase subunit alpha n=1 Tax=Marimonas arenosa TaxID=1795305 RepID=A0AAE4B411_9RHOB|nr:alternate F1F0 ATPase, F1 subunit alpha [Marimonas arenosa]MDQ2088939.1 alternate F1F0 ATPase, F1 subunit alpha [Marimonas arenosa]
MTAHATLLSNAADRLFTALGRSLDQTKPDIMIAEIAHVTSVGDGVAQVRGFTDLGIDELVRFESGVVGYAFSLNEIKSGIVLLGDSSRVRTGDRVARMRRVLDVPVGPELLSRVVNPLGLPLDGMGPVSAAVRLPIERPAPMIMHRAPVATPLQTGIKAIDAAIPVGRGQRQLIVGDRQTGKTSIALDAILNQKDTGVIAVYCAIGQRASAVVRVIRALREHGAIDRTITVVAGADDVPGLEFIAPYAATAMAEHFMEQGRDVVIVFDDLTSHARAYRELSLLLRRPPGREAYPGDVFYIHSRLLERAAQLRDEHGGGSLTALPIIETQAQNLSAYIPTNLISITDGQIYLSPDLFEKGHLPAINIGKSVSRVGGKAQLPAYRAIAGDLRLAHSQFEELETFARFGTRLDEDTRVKLRRGRRVRQVLRQKERTPLSVTQQIAAMLAATQGLLDQIPPEDVASAEAFLLEGLEEDFPDLANAIEEGQALSAEDLDLWSGAISGRLDSWRAAGDGNG